MEPSPLDQLRGNLFGAAFSGTPLSRFAGLAAFHMAHLLLAGFLQFGFLLLEVGLSFPARLCLEVDRCFVGMCASNFRLRANAETAALLRCRPSEA
jgi:hypothetical protein